MPKVTSSQATNPPFSGGSQLEPVYTKREMTLYSINENEVQTLSNLNDQATLGYSLGSFLLSQGVGIYVASSFVEKLSPAGEVAVGYAAPAFLFLAIIAGAWGLSAARRRSRFWKEIKASSSRVN